MKKSYKILTILIFCSSLTCCKFTESTSIKEWTIDEYRITYSRKLGPVGPNYFQYDVYIKGEHLDYGAYLIENDSCLLRFREQNDYYIDFNLCKKTKTILRPDKKSLDLTTIETITIRPYDSVRLVPRETYTAPFYDTIITKGFDPNFTKSLNKKEIEIFVKRWNKSQVNGYDRLGKNYDYLLTIYSNGTMRQIKVINSFLTENEKWSYESKDDNFFDELWKKSE